MGLIFLSVIAFVSIHYFFTTIRWLDPNDDESNIIKLLYTHYEVQYQIGNILSKGMTLYGISQGMVNSYDFLNVTDAAGL